MGKYLENKYQKANRILQEVIKATLADDGNGYLFTPEAVHSILVKKGFVEVNDAISNDAGEFATRATELGLAEAKPDEEEEVKVMPETNFELGAVPKDFVLPVSNRGGSRAPKYPFADMEVDQSFFVANTAVKGENAVKTLTGACSKANKLFGTPSVDSDTGEPVMRGTKNGETQATTFVKIFKAGPYTKGEGDDAVAGAMVVRTA